MSAQTTELIQAILGIWFCVGFMGGIFIAMITESVKMGIGWLVFWPSVLIRIGWRYSTKLVNHRWNNDD